MTKYHVNSETGEPGPCRALYSCPFGSEEQHFSSKEEARAAYEEQMSELAEYRETPLGKLDSATSKAIEKLKSGIQKTVYWMDDHPKIVVGTVGVIAAVAVGVTVHKMIKGHFQGMTSQPFTGTINSGENQRHIVGIMGKGGHMDTDAVYQVSGPNGVFEYRVEDPQLLKNGTQIPLHLYSDGSVHAEAVNPTGQAIEAVAISAGAGAVGGATSALLTSLGINAAANWIDSKWNLRHEDRFGLTNWRTI